MTKGHPMDPNEALRIIREAIAEFDLDAGSGAVEDTIVENFIALDTWLSSGGFKPLAWENFGGLKTPEAPEKPVCADCGLALHQQQEQALSGEFALVWADVDGAWVCPTTGDEHRPERTY